MSKSDGHQLRKRRQDGHRIDAEKRSSSLQFSAVDSTLPLEGFFRLTGMTPHPWHLKPIGDVEQGHGIGCHMLQPPHSPHLDAMSLLANPSLA